MEDQIRKPGAIRRKSPVIGVVFASVVAFLLFCAVLLLFAAKCSFGLLGKDQLKSSVAAMLDDDAFRHQVAETVVAIAPADTLVGEQVAEVMKDEEIAEAVGQLGSDWFDRVIGEESGDPVDAVLAALENPEQKDTFADALEKAMTELECTDEDLQNAADTLALEMGFEPPPKGSSNLEVVTTILDGSREKVKGEASQVIKAVEETKEMLGGAASLLNVLRTLFGNGVFIMIHLFLLAAIYGLLYLLLRNPWRPCYFMGIPYLLIGGTFMCLRMVDVSAVVRHFDLSELAGSVLGVIRDSAFTTGLIGVVIGGVLLAAAITVTIIMNCIENKKEETRVCSVPNAEVF